MKFRIIKKKVITVAFEKLVKEFHKKNIEKSLILEELTTGDVT